MLSLSISESGSLTATQRDFSPTVYLDHWAIRELSEDQRLSNRFTTALGSREGTLALSWANLVEFGKVASEQQTRKAEDLIESNLPRVFFIEDGLLPRCCTSRLLRCRAVGQVLGDAGRARSLTARTDGNDRATGSRLEEGQRTRTTRSRTGTMTSNLHCSGRAPGQASAPAAERQR